MSMKSKSLKGKNIVITGASSGIGKAASLAFARLGANLIPQEDNFSLRNSPKNVVALVLKHSR
jgi:short-subunit dehydrogenase involved in D-alanine esterification of teichoic acids